MWLGGCLVVTNLEGLKNAINTLDEIEKQQHTLMMGHIDCLNALVDAIATQQHVQDNLQRTLEKNDD